MEVLLEKFIGTLVIKKYMETLCFPDELDKVRSMADHSSLCQLCWKITMICAKMHWNLWCFCWFHPYLGKIPHIWLIIWRSKITTCFSKMFLQQLPSGFKVTSYPRIWPASHIKVHAIPRKTFFVVGATQVSLKTANVFLGVKLWGWRWVKVIKFSLC